MYRGYCERCKKEMLREEDIRKITREMLDVRTNGGPKALIINTGAELNGRPMVLENGTEKACKQRRESIKGGGDETTKLTREQVNRLQDSQRQIIIDTFTKMEQSPIKTGLKILVKMFAEYPQYKQIWPQFRAIPDSSLMNAIELRRHASVYMCGLGAIIHSMNNENDLALQMNRIAKAHIKWNVHRKHVIHMLEPVLDLVEECNDGKLDYETKEAWTTLYNVIADLIEIYRYKNSNM
ncbi:globin [Necator americanus]|uniref:Globin n=1 Tax=Necator americanus TaxID=51031 RepID=W2T026_NECAM|nr:globin [Necator americanus]ETN74914.1 globin [Necator americanus]